MNWTDAQQETTLHQQPIYSGLQKEILEHFKNKNNWSIDELALSTKNAVSQISSTLFELELNGALQNIGANRYRLPL
jgi:predicted Rossmann fold nucleotide-binding protein DprA/Smf involved in DNA uptake